VTVPEAQEFPPALRSMGRILAAITGAVTGAAILLIGGLYALLSTCHDSDGESTACGTLVGSLELVAVLGGAAAAIAGGVGTASTGRARWIAGGMAIAIVLVMLLAAVLAEQQPAMT
jgi:hypothetical protein